jgi:hypothetical protein
MNRNILLFGCLCLAAGLLAVHFHKRMERSAAPLSSAEIQPVDSAVSGADVAASSDDSTGPAAKTVSGQVEQDSSLPVSEAAATNVTVAEEKNTPTKDKYEALRELREWASKDPEGALAAAMALPEGDERYEALAAVCSGVAQADPADAVKLAQSLHLDQQPAVMEDLVQQWASADVTSSLAWAREQPAGTPRDEFTTRIAFVMSQSDPSDAATLVMNQIPPGPAQDEAVMTVLHQWANRNFVAAANWAKGTPTGPLQERIINELNGILEYQQGLGQP